MQVCLSSGQITFKEERIKPGSPQPALMSKHRLPFTVSCHLSKYLATTIELSHTTKTCYVSLTETKVLLVSWRLKSTDCRQKCRKQWSAFFYIQAPGQKWKDFFHTMLHRNANKRISQEKFSTRACWFFKFYNCQIEAAILKRHDLLPVYYCQYWKESMQTSTEMEPNGLSSLNDTDLSIWFTQNWLESKDHEFNLPKLR